MKEWKIKMAESLTKNKNFYVFPFKRLMEENGMRHVNRQDAQDIINYVLKNADGIRYTSIDGKPLVDGIFTRVGFGEKSTSIRISRREIEMLSAIM